MSMKSLMLKWGNFISPRFRSNRFNLIRLRRPTLGKQSAVDDRRGSLRLWGMTRRRNFSRISLFRSTLCEPNHLYHLPWYWWLSNSNSKGAPLNNPFSLSLAKIAQCTLHALKLLEHHIFPIKFSWRTATTGAVAYLACSTSWQTQSLTTYVHRQSFICITCPTDLYLPQFGV